MTGHVEAALESIPTVPTPTEPETPPSTTSAASNDAAADSAWHCRQLRRFHMVKSGETCYTIASVNGITLSPFQEWNAKGGSDCGGLWGNAYAFVDPSTRLKAYYYTNQSYEGVRRIAPVVYDV
ncbi:hypothetical protein MCOR25_010234 [Pyricularia grisea]|nr:hypothetical protein MCOR25_010234 [Pyricularia grisea]